MRHYYHEVPGRVRVKSPVLKGNAVLCRHAEDVLRREDGVHEVSANPVTGSIVVKYDPKASSSKAMADLLARNGYFQPEAIPNDRHISKHAERVGQAVGKAVVGAVVEKIFEGSAFSVLTALL